MNNRILKTINDMSLRWKMIISFLVFIMLPFTLISSFMVQHFRDIMIEKSYSQSIENMVRSKSSTVESLQRALTISDKVSLMGDIGNIVNKKYKDNLDVFKTYYDFKVFAELVNDYPEISAIKLYVENDTMLSNWEFIPVDSEIRNRSWYQKALSTKGQNTWMRFQDITKGSNTNLSLVRLVYFREHNLKAVLVIDVDTARLNSIFSKESYETFIVDDYGRIISTNSPEKINELYTELQGDYPRLEDAKGSYNVIINNRKYHLLADDINMRNSTNGLKVFSIFSISTIIEEANDVWWFGLKSILLIFFIASIALYVIYTMFIQRLIKVQQNMDIVANGNFHSFIEIDGKDEIGKLSIHFNHMVKDINALLIEIETSNKQKMAIEQHQNEIKLQMLASQINPHFLFNSLEAIRMKAHIDKQPEISNVVKQLGRLMRRVLEVEGSWTPLKNELEIIQSFLDIEKFRLDQNLSYNLEIENECLDILMPPLLIQPLVENALIHGIEQKPGGGSLLVKAEMVNNQMLISVQDDGPGIKPDKLKSLLDTPENRGAHIGIRNVHERLRLSFGDEFGLIISEPTAGGVLAQFKIPKEKIDD